MPEPNESLMTALAEFAAGAGHEINNPLAIISGHAQVLLEKAETLEERRRLAAIIAQTRRAYEMIADIRLFACPPEPVNSVFSLFSFLEELTADYASPDAEFPATVLIKPNAPFDSDEICTDRQILRMVFDALLRNAVEACAPKETIVQISPALAESPREFRIAVTDNGPGVPQELRSRLFFPYCSGRDAGRGLGFGLPRSWALMKKMGGSLSLDENGFVIILPSSDHL